MKVEQVAPSVIATSPAAMSSQALSPMTWTPSSFSSGQEKRSLSNPQRSPMSMPRGLASYRQRPTT